MEIVQPALDRLGALRDAGWQVMAFCQNPDCVRARQADGVPLDIFLLIQRRGPHFRVITDNLAKYLRCTECGHKNPRVVIHRGKPSYCRR